MNETEFLNELKKMNINLTQKQIDELKTYALFLLEYNKHTNLTAIKSLEEIYLKHFFDSLTLNKIISFKPNDKLLDIGTGAGFPGLVLAICYPQIQITLLDSNNKKIEFLNQLIKKLNLQNVETVHNRIEEYTKEHRETFDYITSRAVKELRIILEISIAALKIGGSFIAMKSSIEEELQAAKDTIEILNTTLIQKEEFNLPNNTGKRTLLNIEKKHITDSKYPRTYNMILKKPLKKKNN